MSERELTAAYRSPDDAQTFVHKLPALPAASTALDITTKTAFLSTLRTKIGEIQTDVNVYLTRKMDDEKAAQTDKGGKAQTKEELEEERYGEEDPEADG